MTKLSKILLTIAITSILSIGAISQPAKAETSDTVDVKQFTETTLKTAYNRFWLASMVSKDYNARTPDKYIFNDCMNTLLKTYNVDSDTMTRMMFSYNMENCKKLKGNDLYSNLFN